MKEEIVGGAGGVTTPTVTVMDALYWCPEASDASAVKVWVPFAIALAFR